MKVKRIDRTVQMMRELNATTAEALEAAALKLQAIAKQAVSRRYAKKPRPKKTEIQKAIDRENRRHQVRQYFLNKPPKAKKNGSSEAQT